MYATVAVYGPIIADFDVMLDDRTTQKYFRICRAWFCADHSISLCKVALEICHDQTRESAGKLYDWVFLCKSIMSSPKSM